jgi:hypothetical protein
MNVRFYIDRETEAPHIHKHGVNEEEVVDVLLSPGEIGPVRKTHGWRSAKHEQGATCALFMLPIPNRTAYL